MRRGKYTKTISTVEEMNELPVGQHISGGLSEGSYWGKTEEGWLMYRADGSTWSVKPKPAMSLFFRGINGQKIKRVVYSD